jgi:hypothetical protein
VTGYYLDLEATHPPRVKTVRLEHFRESKAGLGEFLGVDFGEGPYVQLEKINSAAHLCDDALSAALLICREKYAPRIKDIAERCGYGLAQEASRPVPPDEGV